ncbi:ferritin family protein [Planctomycetota bacterium]
MSQKYSSFEVFQIAEQIESNGEKFYRQAAKIFEKDQVHTLFSRLADWETDHQKLFARMRKEFTDQINRLGTFDPDDYMSSNPGAMAELTAFAINHDPAKWFKPNEKITHILRKAIKNEKDTITFYVGLREFTKDIEAKLAIERLILEEKHHVQILKESLEQRVAAEK